MQQADLFGAATDTPLWTTTAPKVAPPVVPVPKAEPLRLFGNGYRLAPQGPLQHYERDGWRHMQAMALMAVPGVPDASKGQGGGVWHPRGGEWTVYAGHEKLRSRFINSAQWVELEAAGWTLELQGSRGWAAHAPLDADRPIYSRFYPKPGAVQMCDSCERAASDCICADDTTEEKDE